MTQEPQSGPERPEEERIINEFRQLGKNLVEMVQAAWESPERKRLQQEVEAGLDELSTTVKQEVQTFKESPTGQRLKSDFQEARQKFRTGEAQSRVREEILAALKTINAELKQYSDRLAQEEATAKEQGPQDTGEFDTAKPEAGTTSNAGPFGEQNEIHPDDVRPDTPPEV